ncbi:hypothetical protein [Roseivivax isoporae]|uniref:Uncharacterized protein n=1 Tax=Roseivivax isoporae LMG 25204 TaxID=1449351 RepID=X7FB86_9RHOB|nr:hypothetical protein [Roseivivax isoporae]ETX29381.1 hypothetical protein RISW2_01540 [Roseivivax isoporae LMG 25204]
MDTVQLLKRDAALVASVETDKLGRKIVRDAMKRLQDLPRWARATRSDLEMPRTIQVEFTRLSSRVVRGDALNDQEIRRMQRCAELIFDWFDARLNGQPA